MKRAFDITMCILAILICTPLWIALAIAVRCDSNGPVIFRQVRVGRAGVAFWILKFRTMTSAPIVDGPLITTANDARITRVGAILRRFKLDELPQLWNILRGDMSVVGPRPEVPHYVALYPERERTIVLSVRPGLTDFATIALRDEQALLAAQEDVEAYYRNTLLPFKINMGVLYARSHTMCLDCRLIFLTLLAIIAPTASPVRALRTSLSAPELPDPCTPQ